MIEIPDSVRSSTLYRSLVADIELLNAVVSLRSAAASLAETVTRTVPVFTDHTVKHMDALWAITDCILTQSEVQAFHAEKHSCLHAVSICTTSAWPTRLPMRAWREFAHCRFTRASRPAFTINAGNPRFTARPSRELSGAYMLTRHSELARGRVPGTEVYLFESASVREAWGETAGRVAASHHWNLDTLDREIGEQGSSLCRVARNADIAYVASILRLADYAHINRDRAPRWPAHFARPWNRRA